MKYYYRRRTRVKTGTKMVRWLFGAALITYHLSLITSLTSCTDDLTDAGVDDGNYRFTRAYSNEQVKLQRLGYAYNAAGNVMDDSSFSAKPVINIDRLKAAEKTYGLIINSELRHYTSMDIYSGNTLQELGHEETKFTVDDSEAIGSGKYYRNNKTTYTGRWENCYKAHMFIKHVMATMTIDAGILRCLNLDNLDDANSVLEADFRKDVAKLVKSGIDTASATKFSEKYGTHLVVSSNLGGMIELQLEINRDSCVDRVYTTQQVSEIILGKKVTKTTNSKVISEISKHSVQYHGQISVKGGAKNHCDSLHRIFDETKAAAVKISDGDYYNWANHISIEPDNYNASFIGGRYLPFYELFEDSTTRRALRKAYELYLKKEAPTQEIYEPDYGVMPVAGNYGPDVRVAAVDSIATPHSDQGSENKACIMCQEYVPSIRSDKPCVVAYPLIRGADGNVRPFLYTGLFVGDESHRPGRVVWEGSSSVYTPSDSIFYESDSTSIRKLFDPETHALRNVYFYWNAVHAQPCPTAVGAPKTYSSSVFTTQPATLAEPTTVAKVASTFWSVRPVVMKTESMQEYWKQDRQFQIFATKGAQGNNGPLFKVGKYCYCLVDGGDNIKRVKDFTDDNEGNKQWTAAVSQSVKAIGLNDYLPTVAQSKSITRMLGNRMSVFYDRSYDGRNMLGLDWPGGYWVLSAPGLVKTGFKPEQNDGQGMPVITNDKGQVRILRLSGSGTDLLLDYLEYVRAFNYSDQMYFKFFPIYITVNVF